MKFITKTLVFCTLAAILSGCATPPPPETPEQRETRLNSTLHVYDDNRVVFGTSEPSGINSWYYISSDPDKIITLVTKGHRYNLKDLERAELRGVPKSYNYPNGLEIKFRFKDGAEISSWGALWQVCNRMKSCSEPSRHKNFMMAISQRDLFQDYKDFFARDKKGWGGLITSNPYNEETPRDGLALPGWAGDNINLFLFPDSEMAKLQAQVKKHEEIRAAAIQKDKKDEAGQRASDFAAEQARERETKQMRRTIRIGTKTNCGLVYDLRGPVVGVQTVVGLQYIELNRLYGPSSGCFFRNGQYIGDKNQ